MTIFAAFAGLAYPIQRQVMNVAIPDSNYRASILSAESVLDRAFCAVVAHQVSDYVAQHHMDIYLGHAGTWCLAATAVIVVVARKRVPQNE